MIRKIYGAYTIYCLALSSFIPHIQAQTGINTKTPDQNTVLDIVSTTKGVLIPRLNLAEATVLKNNSPANGMLIYNTDNDCIQIFVGDEFRCLTSEEQVDKTIDAWHDNATNSHVELATTSGGNSRTAGTEVVLKDDGKVGIGTTDPLTTLEIRANKANGNLIADDVAPKDGLLVPRVKRLTTDGMENGQLVYLSEGYSEGNSMFKEGFYHWRTDHWKANEPSSKLDLEGGGSLLILDGEIQVAQEVTVLMTADHSITGTSTTIPIKNLNNEQIDNKNAFTGNSFGNSFIPEATGIYQVLINVLVSNTSDGKHSPVVGIVNDSNGKWVARINPQLTNGGKATMTLITAIELIGNQSYSFRLSSGVPFTIFWESKGSTGEGPVSFFSIKRLK